MLTFSPPPCAFFFLAACPEGEDCDIQFAEGVLLPAAEKYRRDRPDYDPNYDDPDDTLQFYIALDVSIALLARFDLSCRPRMIYGLYV